MSPSRLLDSVLARWPLWAFIASGLMLAIAILWFQDYRGLNPCILCLKQRQVYWAAGGIGLVGVVAGFTPWRGWAVRGICGLLAIAFLAGMGLAIWHAGAEWKFWPGPAACALNRVHISAADLAAALSGTAPKHVPSCEEAAWRMFGVSMAGYNVVISLGLAVMSVLAAMRKVR